MFHNFGFEVSTILEMAEKEREELRHPYVGSEHLLLAILKNDSEVSSKLQSAGLTYHKFKSELVSVVGNATKLQELILYTPLLKRILELSDGTIHVESTPGQGSAFMVELQSSPTQSK